MPLSDLLQGRQLFYKDYYLAGFNFHSEKDLPIEDNIVLLYPTAY